MELKINYLSRNKLICGDPEDPLRSCHTPLRIGGLAVGNHCTTTMWAEHGHKQHYKGYVRSCGTNWPNGPLLPHPGIDSVNKSYEVSLAPSVYRAQPGRGNFSSIRRSSSSTGVVRRTLEMYNSEIWKQNITKTIHFQCQERITSVEKRAHLIILRAMKLVLLSLPCVSGSGIQ